MAFVQHAFAASVAAAQQAGTAEGSEPVEDVVTLADVNAAQRREWEQIGLRLLGEVGAWDGQGEC